MYCNNCGKKLEDGDRFCTVCGTMVSSAAKETQEVPGEQTVQEYENVQECEGMQEPQKIQEPAKRYRKRTGILVGVVAGIGAVILVALAVCVNVAALRAGRALQNSGFSYENRVQQEEEDTEDDREYDPPDDFHFGSGNSDEDNMDDFF